MRKVFEKVTAIITLSIMLLASSSTVLTYAYDMVTADQDVPAEEASGTWYVHDRKNIIGTNAIYEYNGDYIWGYGINKSKSKVVSDTTYARYCLLGGYNVNHDAGKAPDASDSKGNYGIYNTKENFSQISNAQITKIFGNNNNKKAVEWLLNNMYTFADGNGKINSNYNGFSKEYERDIMLNHLIEIIKDKTGVQYNSLSDFGDGYISTIQQFVLWNFTNSKSEYKHGSDVNFIKNIKCNGKAIDSDKIAIAQNLYKALYKSACDIRDGKTLSTTMATNISTSDVNIKLNNGKQTISAVTNEENTYIIGPISASVTGNVNNIEEVTDRLKIEVGQQKIESKKYMIDTTTELTQTTIKNIIVGKVSQYYIKVKLDSPIADVDQVRFRYTITATSKRGISELNKYVYTKSNSNRQPIIEIDKSLNHHRNSATLIVNHNADYSGFDMALTKQIAQIYRYDASKGKYVRVYDSEVKEDTDTNHNNDKSENIVYGTREYYIHPSDMSEDKGVTTATYALNKEPITVEPGDIVRYKITVYNEGSVDGFVGEITDYLPSGLEYLENSTTSTNYGKYNYSNQNLITTNYDKANNTVVMTYKTKQSVKAYGNGESFLPENKLDTYIECKVSSNVKNGTSLRNVSEISKYGYNDKSGNYIEASKKKIDRDSIQNNTNINSYDEVTGSTMIYKPKVDLENDLEDDQDFEEVKVGEFDLALRKFITEVNGEALSDSREPTFAWKSIEQYRQTGTAAYYHTKAPLTVKKGDIVTYTIRVYNEGDIDGIVKKITDYIPNGLNYINNAYNQGQGWKVSSSSDRIIVNENLKKVKATKDGFLKVYTDAIAEEEKFWVDVNIQCEVVEDKKSTVLTNVAEISDYGYNKIISDANGANVSVEYLQASKGTKKTVDRDSEQANTSEKLALTSENEITTSYYQYQATKHDITNTEENFYEGLEDDDDFEDVIVDTHKFYIKKTDSTKRGGWRTLIQDAEFKVEKITTGGSSSTDNVEVIHEGTFGGRKAVEEITQVNTPYIYQITETKAGDGYTNLLGNNKIYVVVYLNNKGELAFGWPEGSNNVKQEYIDNICTTEIMCYESGKNFLLIDQNGNILKKTENEALYNSIWVTYDTRQEAIFVTVQDPLMSGNYNLKLKKEDEAGQQLAGASFEINKENGSPLTLNVNDTKTEYTTENIIINAAGKDKYTISEVSTPDGYISLKDSIDIYVTTGEDDAKTNYIVKGISFTEDGIPQTQAKLTAALVKEGKTVEINASVENGTVVLTIPNKHVEGSYCFKILKTDINGSPLAGAEFNIIGASQISGDSNVTPINGTLSSEKIVIADIATRDKFTITEIKAPNGYIKLAEPLNVYVAKGLSDDKTRNVVTGIAFEEEAEIASKIEREVSIDGDKGTVKVVVEIEKDTGDVLLTIPNIQLEGSYSIDIVKKDSEGNAIKGVKFGIKEKESEQIISDETDSDGKATIVDTIKITKDNVSTPDEYTITEIEVPGDYIKLKKPLTFSVIKGVDNEADPTEYRATAVNFENGSNSIEVELENGNLVTVYAEINSEDGRIVITIPNILIQGKYNFEILKVDQKDENSPIKDVEFNITVKENGTEAKLYDINGDEINTTGLITDENGKISLPEIKIDKEAQYSLEVVETSVPYGYVKMEEPIKVTFETKISDNYKYIITNHKIDGADAEYSDDSLKLIIKNGQFDLALRKFITGITTGAGTEEEKNWEITDREPKFKIDEEGKYVYEHTKEPLTVGNQNIVEYTLRVYNEGSLAGYASKIKDDIPEGLEFLPDNETNKKYGWIMLDEAGNETEDVNKAKYVVTKYLSKEDDQNGQKLIGAFYPDEMESPAYQDVKIAFKVTMPDTEDKIIINHAQISDDSDENGKEIDDKDSIPDEWNEGEDDQDIEKVKVQYFDLALRKWVTKAIVIENGKETVTETGHTAEDDPEEIVKVDLKKSSLKNIVVKFEYKIRITNEGEIAGYAKEISDYIPEGLRFDQAENPLWQEAEGKVTTDQLKDKLLNPGESVEVSIILTWINREDNMGLKVNVAEISKDYNEYGTPDIDSTPNNQKPGEDDIDDAKVMLTVKTGEIIFYIGTTIAVLTILGVGIVGIKKYVLK